MNVDIVQEFSMQHVMSSHLKRDKRPVTRLNSCSVSGAQCGVRRGEEGRPGEREASVDGWYFHSLRERGPGPRSDPQQRQ